jgi:ribosomal protein L37AE/L43A
MADKYPTPQDQAFADCWLKYGGNVFATTKALNDTTQYGKVTPALVRQSIGRVARFGRLPSPDLYRIKVAKVLAKNRGSADNISPDILVEAQKLEMDPHSFRSRWPARSKADPTAPNCPHCRLSGRVRRRSQKKSPNRWNCLGCSKQFCWPKHKPGPKIASEGGTHRTT